MSKNSAWVMSSTSSGSASAAPTSGANQASNSSTTATAGQVCSPSITTKSTHCKGACKSTWGVFWPDCWDLDPTRLKKDKDTVMCYLSTPLWLPIWRFSYGQGLSWAHQLVGRNVRLQMTTPATVLPLPAARPAATVMALPLPSDSCSPPWTQRSP